MKVFDKTSFVISVVMIFILAFMFGNIGAIVAHAASPSTVNLGTAGNFVILAKTGISTTGNTSVVGDMGVSPAAASYITGFALTLPAASASSTSAQVTGKIYAPDYADPTPTNVTTAVLDMQNAYTDAMGRAPDVTELGAGNIGGLTLVPGVYKWSTGVTIPSDLTLSGGANDVWIFQVAQNLSLSSATRVILAGGAQASNVFWVVAGQTTIGTTAVFNGTILDQTTIVLNTGAILNGRALAQAAATLDSSTVIAPSSSGTPPISTLIPSSSSTSSGQVTSMYTSYTPTLISNSVSNPAAQTSALTPSQDAQVASLRTQLTGLLVILRALQEAPQQGQDIRTIASDLKNGASDTNVTILQQFLIAQNKGPAAAALANAGATAYFGVLTRAALAEFQVSAGISPALGNFGPLTRAYISTH